MKKAENKQLKQLNIRNVVIARGSRSALRRTKAYLHANALDAIECGNWWIPFDSYEYVDIKKHLEKKVFHEFFRLPNKLKIAVESFQTDILSFDKGH